MPMQPLALAPDQRLVAWAWNWELGVMEVDGGVPRVVTRKLLAENLGESAMDPTWSPDGSEILFRWVGANRAPSWYRIHVLTEELTEVPIPIDCRAMAWSPDGSTLACQVWRQSATDPNVEISDLFQVDLETFDVTPLTNVDDAVEASAPAWSPDGRWLAFALASGQGTGEDPVDGIWVMDVETLETQRLLPGGIDAPTWSPDGGYLAAYDGDQGRVIIFGRDGSGLTVLDHEPRQYIWPRWVGD